MSADRATALDQVLRERGLRATPQRRMVLRAVSELGHATPEQVCEFVQGEAASLNLSTVYRALELLEGLGVVSHTHLQHGSPTYQVADHVDHLHLVCRRCGSITEADLVLAVPLADSVAAAHGFRTDLSHLSLHGLCGDCQAQDADPGGARATPAIHSRSHTHSGSSDGPAALHGS